MNSTHRIGLGLAIALTGATRGHAGALPGVDARIDNRMIVQMETGVPVQTFIDAYLTAHPTLVSMGEVDQVPGRPIYLLNVHLPQPHDPLMIDALELDLMSSYAGILRYGDFLYTNEGPEGKSGSIWVDGIVPGVYWGQYALDHIGVGIAHERSTGIGTAVAVLDTGLDTDHPLFAGAVLPGGYDFVDNDSDISDTGDGADNDGDGMTDELVGHGTFVAGIVHLVAPDAKLLPIRVLGSDGRGDEWMLTRGLFHAIDAGVEVINMSLGSTYDTNSVKQALAEANSLGIVVTASAGNLNRDTPREFPAMDDLSADDPIDPPLHTSGALGVAATDRNDVKADFSSYSRRIVISAPGDITTAPGDPLGTIVSAFPNNNYVAWEGTSFANAFVSGTAALIRAQHPSWAADVATGVAIETAMTSSAFDLYPLNPQFAADDELGAGRLDTGAAVTLGPSAPSLGDLDANGVVEFADVLILIGDWGLTHSSADLNCDGIVGFADVLVLIARWG